MPEPDQLASLKIDRSSQARRGRLPAIIATLVVLGGIGAVAGWAWLRAPRAAEVRTAVAREVAMNQEATVLNASGYVTARRQATVSSKVTGRILEVLIEEGMEVEEGELMATLDDSNTRMNLRLAESELEAARTALEETRVRLHEAELDLGRIRSLAEREIVPRAELDRTQATYDSLAARIDQQEDQALVAERRISLWQQELADREIRAPFAGIVVSKNAQPGEMISPLSAGGAFTRTGIGTIVDMSSLEIEVDVNEAYINRVKPGQPVVATLDAYSDWEIPAHVIAIVPTADRQRATVRVRIGFEQLDPRILRDMGVKVAFRDTMASRRGAETLAETGSGVRTIIVPAEAVRRDRGQDVVFVVDDGVAERRAVTVTESENGEAFIISGLSPGERVVIEGPDELADGDPVQEVS